MRALRVLRSECGFVAIHFILLASICLGVANATPIGPASTGHALEFVTEDFPPLNFNNNGSADGFGSEVVREILRRVKRDASLTVLPWARAYKMAQTRANVGIYCIARTPERENLFQWIGPIGILEARFYANKESDLQLSTIDDAKAANHVIVLREGYNAQMLEKRGFKNLLLVNSATEGLRLLLISGSKSLFLVSSAVIPELLRRTSTSTDAIKPVLTISKSQLYIGFSHDTSPDFVDQLQRTLDTMKSDRSFATIYQKWFPGEKPLGLKPDPELAPVN